MPRKSGGIILGHILNERGTIEAEVTCTHIARDRFYLLFAAFHELRVVDWLTQRIRLGEQVTVENVSKDYGCLVLSGPNAREVLRQTTQAPLDNDNFPWLQAKQITVAGVPVRALRVSYVGELGWELHVPMEHTLTVYDALWEAGHSYGIANFGSYALNAMRLEKGFKGASELTNEVTLPEADVMRFAKLDKDEFIGRDATLASMEGTLPWKCVYLAVDVDGVDCNGSEAVVADGRRVGAVTAGAYGHHVSQSLAFAYVDPAYADPGRTLDVMILGEPRTARVLDRAMYDPDNQRPRM